MSYLLAEMLRQEKVLIVEFSQHVLAELSPKQNGLKSFCISMDHGNLPGVKSTAMLTTYGDTTNHFITPPEV